MTYEPFTPAGSGEQRRYDGRRRADDPQEQWTAPEGQWAGAPEDQWAEPEEQWAAAPQTRPADPWGAPADPWGQPGQGQPGQWTEPAPRQQRARVEEQRWDTPAPIPQQRHTGEQQRFTGEQQQHTGEQQRFTGEQQRYAGEQQAWPAAPGRTGEPESISQRSASTGNRIKPLVIGAVVLLLLVAGWQAYRIEGMSRHNQDLATVLSAEQDRTDRLEKELAGVFDPEGVSSGVLPSVFRVRAGSFTGTAFSVGKKAGANQANLITNYHVVAETWTDGGRRVSLERGSTRINATIVKVDKGKDLALLRAAQTIAPLGAAPAQVKPGQQVVVVGAPLGLDDSVTTGVISAYRPNDADGPTIQFDAPINPGNSGGPVVNSSKQVVGVATAKAKDAEGIGLAIPIKTACQTLAVC
ncbi:trypsin-like peptidase domain-containing protein [Paractinoplanes lichenicola]|uniref:Trypsin-like peptidase domain-containing protein n=1 Tax=Paractinoplanes lichenicola TaxID=2802976 RepID=A0ABS1VGJ8_9ACTN|nr:trypsin-like peptidase domain-containing protein [Actinoplanes lichenicola]MBL7253745.1 trypsin-like peptidase domain-containing protein [Actinoplanes lichenicola]